MSEQPVIAFASAAEFHKWLTRHHAEHSGIWLCCTSELEEVVVVGEVAYTRSRDALSVTPRAGGKAAQLAGHRMTVYSRQRDGRWLLCRDVHTLAGVG